MKLPLEILREKYIPIEEFPAKFGISVSEVMKLVESKKVRRAEFKAPNSTRRSLHVNYEEVLVILGRGGEIK